MLTQCRTFRPYISWKSEFRASTNFGLGIKEHPSHHGVLFILNQLLTSARSGSEPSINISNLVVAIRLVLKFSNSNFFYPESIRNIQNRQFQLRIIFYDEFIFEKRWIVFLDNSRMSFLYDAGRNVRLLVSKIYNK